MKEELLSVLAEPVTGRPLDLEVIERRDGDVWEGRLRPVGASDRIYTVRCGIPRFVSDDRYTDSFGLQWNRYSIVQLDSRNGSTESAGRFRNETGWTADALDGRWVLDAGCGCGRFAEVAAGLGANVVALDYSSAVEAAARNLERFPGAHVVQGDLLAPPFRFGAFDFAYSIGVLQHTPDPSAAVRSIVELVAPGGSLALTIYARRWYTRLHAKYLIRPVTRRLPPGRLLGLVRGVMPVAFPVTDALFRVPGLGSLARFVIPVANYVEKAHFTRAQRYAEAELDTFDMLSPAYDSPMTPCEVAVALRGAGAGDLRFLQDAPVNVLARIPGESVRGPRRGTNALGLATPSGGRG